MTYSFTFGFLVTAPGEAALSPDVLEATLDGVMEAMLDRESEAVFDPAVGATLAEGRVEIELSVQADNDQAAANAARDLVVAAIAEVGGAAVGPFVFAGGAPASGAHTWHERRVELRVA